METDLGPTAEQQKSREELRIVFADWVAEYLILENITTAEFATRINKSPEWVTDFFNYANVTVDELCDVAHELGCCWQVLLIKRLEGAPVLPITTSAEDSGT